MHDHEHDEDGQLVRTVVRRESEWDDDEVSWMLALALYRAQLCPSGHWTPESTDPANEGRYRGRAIRCHACNATAIKADAAKESPHPTALLFGAELMRG